MEDHREEYLASGLPRPIAHIAEVEENLTEVINKIYLSHLSDNLMSECYI